MEKFVQYLNEAKKIIQTADHMVYVTFPLIKEKKILLKVLLETKTAIANCINSILQYEYLFKRIPLYKEPEVNFKIFKDRCALRYKITKQEISLIDELFEIVKRQKESHFEFIKNNKIVILSESLEPKTITIEKVKEFLTLSKSILEKSQEAIFKKNIKSL